MKNKVESEKPSNRNIISVPVSRFTYPRIWRYNSSLGPLAFSVLPKVIKWKDKTNERLSRDCVDEERNGTLVKGTIQGIYLWP